MKVNQYKTILDEDRLLNVLVKEKGTNYSKVSNLKSPEDVYKMMDEIYNLSLETEEHLYLLCLNTKNKLLGIFKISHGTVNASFMSKREVLIKALLCGSVNNILVHNHPSQDTTPSQEDIVSTKNMIDAFQSVGLTLLDHIIIGNGYRSLKEEGLI